LQIRNMASVKSVDDMMRSWHPTSTLAFDFDLDFLVRREV